MTEKNYLSAVILISGRGSNMISIVEHQKAGNIPLNIKAIISDNQNAAGLQFAKDNGICTSVVDAKKIGNRDLFNTQLKDCVDSYKPDLVILAGFMKILTADLVNAYTGKMLNIHPSLLPNFPGLDTHNRALKSGHKEHGASVHFVTEELDGGPVIIQAVVPIESDDTEDTLSARVLTEEHKIYPLTVKLFAEKRLKCINNEVYIDDHQLKSTVTVNKNDITKDLLCLKIGAVK